MLERDLIQRRGFTNVADASGAVTGFRLDLRMPNYRGVAGSLVEGVEVVVDGETFPPEVGVWTLQGREFTLDELRRSTDVRWAADELATVTVPRPGGLRPGPHQVAVAIRLRAPYIPAFAQPSVFRAEGVRVIVPDAPVTGPRLGVSLYSYAGDMFTSMTLEDAMADIADLGATGIEILGEAHVPGYPEPSTAWIDSWHAGLDRYGLVPTNLGAWVDTAMWLDRDLTVDEGAAQLTRDLRLAHRLGFGFLRPKFGVVSPELDPHPIWAPAVERVLGLAADLDVVICPEIHSPTPLHHPVVDGYREFIRRTGSKHFRLMVDTGIFQTVPVDDGHEGFAKGKRPAFLEPLAVPASDLEEMIDDVAFIQTKFFEIDDAGHDLHIPWEPIVDVLRRTGWDGWLSSEYEGRREPYRGRDQVRRQHALLRGLLGG